MSQAPGRRGKVPFRYDTGRGSGAWFTNRREGVGKESLHSK